MIVYTTHIPEDVSIYLRLQEYELSGYEYLIQSLLMHMSDKPDKWRDQQMEKLQQGYRTAFFTKTMVFDDIAKRYLPEQYRSPDYRLKVNFNKNEVYVND